MRRLSTSEEELSLVEDRPSLLRDFARRGEVVVNESGIFADAPETLGRIREGRREGRREGSRAREGGNRQTGLIFFTVSFV